MKKFPVTALIFTLVFVITLIANAPMALMVKVLPQPQNVQLHGVSGTIWTGKASLLQINNEQVSRLNWQIQPLSLLTLSPKAKVRFGDIDGVNGRGEIGWNGTLYGERVLLNAPLPWLIERLPLQRRPPVPLYGTLQLNLSEFALAKPWCERFEGTLTWLNAAVEGISNRLDLNEAEARLSCTDSRLTALITQKSTELEFNGKFELKRDRSYLLTGAIKAGKDLSEPQRQTLLMLGKPNASGAVPIRHQGKF